MKRIQRKRTKGWKMPENTVYVGRPTKWGNPFMDVGDMVYVWSPNRTILDPWIFYGWMFGSRNAVQLYDDCVLNNVMPYTYFRKIEQTFQDYYYDYFRNISQNIGKLKGKDLACWCPLDKLCHADILLRLANSEENA